MLKRASDIILAILAMLILSPVYLYLTIQIAKKLSRPVLFRQTRPGLNGKLFKLIKFRSMLDAKDVEGNNLPDKERMTSFGNKLRASSLDELPEFWNVLKGDMSLVGPRPLLVEYLPLYSDEQKKRHDVRPGITGWAQVNGRNAISWEDKFSLDLWYIQNRSLLLDLKILIKTVQKVFAKEGISAENEVTMPAFKGNTQR
jgi:lipopolysaccharide/colanic/teichoic acid biosynthesis glycosyltransferase